MEKDELMNAQKDQILALLAEKEASVLECLEIKKQSQVLHSQVEQLKLQLKVVSQSHQTYEHDQNLLKSLRKENLRLKELIDKATAEKEAMKKQITEYLQGFNQYEDAIQQKENEISNHVDQIGSQRMEVQSLKKQIMRKY